MRGMLPHQQRVVDERAQLSERYERLGSFFKGAIYPTLELEEQADLTAQHGYMRQYLGVLDRRIERMLAPKEKPPEEPGAGDAPQGE